MANPNIVNVTSINGGLAHANLTFGTTTTLVTNSSNSGFIYKINSIHVANKSATDTGVSVHILSGGTDYYIAYEVACPDHATLVITDKNSGFYLMENDVLKATATTPNNNADIVVSYDIIND